jgi:hypothetical protein
VPFVVRFDPIIGSPWAHARLVFNIDFAPTIAELANVAAPGAEETSLARSSDRDVARGARTSRSSRCRKPEAGADVLRPLE